MTREGSFCALFVEFVKFLFIYFPLCCQTHPKFSSEQVLLLDHPEEQNAGAGNMISVSECLCVCMCV